MWEINNAVFSGLSSVLNKRWDAAALIKFLTRKDAAALIKSSGRRQK